MSRFLKMMLVVVLILLPMILFILENRNAIKRLQGKPGFEKSIIQPVSNISKVSS